MGELLQLFSAALPVAVLISTWSAACARQHTPKAGFLAPTSGLLYCSTHMESKSSEIAATFFQRRPPHGNPALPAVAANPQPCPRKARTARLALGCASRSPVACGPWSLPPARMIGAARNKRAMNAMTGYLLRAESTDSEPTVHDSGTSSRRSARTIQTWQPNAAAAITPSICAGFQPTTSATDQGSSCAVRCTLPQEARCDTSAARPTNACVPMIEDAVQATPIADDDPAQTNYQRPGPGTRPLRPSGHMKAPCRPQRDRHSPVPG